MKSDPIQALARRRGLDGEQARRLRLILAEIERDEHAPTAVREPSQAAERHLADSLVGLEVSQIGRARVLGDLGSGAGFPGLALAVALPQAGFSLIESRRRSCEFLARVIATAGLENVEVACTRAEEWRQGLARHDVILARALAAQAVVLEYAAPLLRRGGALVDWRGRREEAQERASAQAAELLGLRLLEIRRVEPFAGASDRHLHVFEKERDTPERFPRRAGIARKRPLGG